MRKYHNIVLIGNQLNTHNIKAIRHHLVNKKYRAEQTQVVLLIPKIPVQFYQFDSTEQLFHKQEEKAKSQLSKLCFQLGIPEQNSDLLITNSHAVVKRFAHQHQARVLPINRISRTHDFILRLKKLGDMAHAKWNNWLQHWLHIA